MTGKEKAMTDCTRILDYMQEHGSITGYQATNELHIMDYRKRISEIIRDGVNIRKIWKTHTNEDGKTSRFIEYSLEGKA